MIQSTVLLITTFLMLMVCGVFIFVALNGAKPAVAYPPLQSKAYRIRSVFFWVLAVAGVLITLVTLVDLPYAATRGVQSDGALEIAVEGRQWFWQMDKTSAQAGDTVVFKVTAGDVNHGLGVYGPEMRLVGQTQAMPGYENRLELRLERPGTYRLMCMEYCGVAHHAMISELTVSGNAE